MTEILQNAIYSLQMGLEDYQSNDARRPISAVRNFYAGVLLLGKECLLKAAPRADKMEVLALRYEPELDGNGGIKKVVKGYRTIDLEDLKSRFSKFQLRWPPGDIASLQKLRNEFEHYHSAAPKAAIQQTIAACFPLIDGFFRILELSPAEELGNAWTIMLQEQAFFAAQKAECDNTLQKLPWWDGLSCRDQFACPTCKSSLIFQNDAQNNDPASIRGRCKACGAALSAEMTVDLIVDAEFGALAHNAIRDCDISVICCCPECGRDTYVNSEDSLGCFFCEYVVSGECARCSTAFNAENISVNNASVCDYCDHVMSRDD